MDQETKKRYQQLLETRLTALKAESTSNAEARNIVTLDQQSVGRLSRMDALQQQAMANATQARRNVESGQIKAALLRLHEDEFGYCDTCGDDIPEARLTLSPTATKCISCIHL